MVKMMLNLGATMVEVFHGFEDLCEQINNLKTNLYLPEKKINTPKVVKRSL